MKKILWIALIVIPLIYIGLRISPLSSIFSGKKVPVAIIGQDLPLVLYVDNRLIGTLPLEDVSVTPGVHTFSLYSVLGENETKQWWQEEMEVSSGDDVSLVIQSSNAHVEGVALLKLFDEMQSTVSKVFVTPDSATVTLQENSYNTFPLVLESLAQSEHVFEINGGIYTSMRIAVELPAHTQVELHVKLFFDYISSIAKADDLIIEPTADVSVPVTRRWDWEAFTAPVPANSLATATWKSLDVYRMHNPQNERTTGLLQKLEQAFQDQDDLFRLPFGFVIDDSGTIYEGLGVWDFDYSLLSTPVGSFYKGGCPILLLGDTVNESQQKALNYLAAFTTSSPQYSAEMVDIPQRVDFATEEVHDVSVRVRNNGWGMWRNIDGHSVTVRLSDASQRSDVYNPDLWIDVSTVISMEDPLVLSGAETTFIMPLKGPSYPIGYDETFVLYQDDTRMSNSEFSLSLHISGEGTGVEILATPIGFLNVRETPSGNGRLVGSAYPGERYLLLESSGDWHKIRLSDGTEGWVSGDYITPLPAP